MANMNDEVLVKVEGVSKKFCWSLSRFIGNLKLSLWYGEKDISSELFGSKKNGQLHFLRVTLSVSEESGNKNEIRKETIPLYG
jgi:hypothetical protein